VFFTLLISTPFLMATNFCVNAGRFFVGLARDRFGTRNVLCSCLVVATLGTIVVALSDTDNVAALSVSLCAIGLGSGVQLCSQPVASLFPQHAGAVTTSLSGAFQISGLIFLALTIGSASRQTSFLIFAASLVFLTVVSAFLFPLGGSFLLDDVWEEEKKKKQMVKTTLMSLDPSEDSTHVSATHPQRTHEDQKQSEEELELNDSSPDDPPQEPDMQAETKTAMEQMKTMEYILLLVWFTVCLVPMQYYVGIIGYLLEEKGDDTGFFTNLFAWVYAGATIVSPFAGWLADKYGLGFSQGVATVLVAGSFFVLASEASLEVQSIGMVSYGIGRLSIFGYYFANIGARFGYIHFGTLAGLGLLISAIASLAQIALIDLAANGNAVVVNVVVGIVLVLQAPYFIWLFRRERRYDQATDT
jgi:MFS transporter, LAT3 family, solute carrier family 43, member 3